MSLKCANPTESCDPPWLKQAPSAKPVAERPLLIDIHVSLGKVDTTGGMAGCATPAVSGGAMAAGGTAVEHVVGATRCSK